MEWMGTVNQRCDALKRRGTVPHSFKVIKKE
ncbi:MAG: hypothetical protein K0Q73_7062 [Paenibacillus sp.]|jgi:hypothetical protein|nr:hypothetical protein [Paenibacillus sp.]